MDGIKLVVCFRMAKAGTELSIHPLRWCQWLSRCNLTLRSNFHQLVGNILDFILDFSFSCLPCDTAQLIQNRITAILAISGQHIDIFNRQI